MHRLWTVAVIVAIQSFAVSSFGQQTAPGASLRPGTFAPKTAFAIIQGNALTASNKPLRDASVRLRDARSGRIVNAAQTDQTGLFVFNGVEPGSYIVELVGSDQTVLAASTLLDVNSGETISTLVRLPLETKPLAGVLGHTTMSAILVTATAAATGVLATRVAGEPVSPRR